MAVPCVHGNIAGLSIFQATADQRYSLGEEVFLQTHLPVQFWLKHTGTHGTWREEDLLRVLLDRSPAVRGNRVFVLFGAAGAGKSEVMRWLMLRMAQVDPSRSRFCLRIARTELDPVKIVSRILQAFDSPGLTQATLDQWAELQRKPVALANQMVWQALAGMYQSDEEILPLSYRLRPVVEANLRAGFTALSDPDATQRPLQLLSQEQLEQVLEDTVFELAPVYEQLRSRLQEALEQLVLGGVRLVPTLKEISRQVVALHGVRPVLIVDDLVQSMNVYASDLLDYLITLEEGEWDVVLGLTPAAFEWDRRGRELLMRVRELDTVDDRVVKLDLSDATGDTSAFLEEGNAEAFLAPYLQVYKQQGGYACGHGCPHYSSCVALQWNQRSDAVLSPFNPAFVRRMWRKLPRGKGRVRYLLLAVRRAIEVMATGEANGLQILSDLIERDTYVEHQDQRVRAVLECYHPGGNGQGVDVPAAIQSIWGLETTAPTVVQELRPNLSVLGEERAEPQDAAWPQGTDPVQSAVRDWLEGGVPNKELLKPLRQGIARFIREIVDPTLLVGGGHAQPNGVLRWSEVRDGVNVPLSLEGIDDEPGILIPRTIGSHAFDFVEYGIVRGPARNRLAARLTSASTVLHFLWDAEDLQRTWQYELETALRCSIREFAFHAHRVALAMGAGLPVPVIYDREACSPLPGVEWPIDLARLIQLLWEDSFRLRDHLYDGHLLARCRQRWPLVSDSLSELEQLLGVAVPTSFQLGTLPLAQVFADIKRQIDAFRAKLITEAHVWTHRKALVETCLRFLDGRSRAGLSRRWERLVAVADGAYSIPVFPMVAPREDDATEVIELSRLVADVPSPSDVIAFLRLSVAWTRIETLAWVAEVFRWHEAMNSMYALARKAAGLEQLEGSMSNSGIQELVHATATLLVESRKHREQRARLESLRLTLEDPLWGEARKWAGVLPVLAPEDYTIGGKLSGAVRQARELVDCWERAAAFLEGPPARRTAPIALRPDAAVITMLQSAVKEAVQWWSIYIEQLGVAQLVDVPLQLDRVLDFLMVASVGKQPDTKGLTAWAQFLATVKRYGTRDLPVVSLCQRRDLPESLRHWLADFVASNGGRMTLRGLPVQTLALLNEYAPEWTEAIHLSVIPEGVNSGVLRLMDRQ